MTLRKMTTLALGVPLFFARQSYPAEPTLIAIGSVSGLYEDFAKQTAGRLENNVPGNRLGGIGSGLAWLGDDTFFALPDRGPNAVSFNSCTDDTVSYINRFQTFRLSLSASDPGSKLPFTLTPMLTGTTLLSSHTPLVYGAGCGAVGSGAPALNAVDRTHYFTGRSRVKSLTADPADLDPTQIPAKLEGIAFGADLTSTDPATNQTITRHTLFVANDNDFLATLSPPVGTGDNPNQFFVYAFNDADLPSYVPQQFQNGDDDDDDDHEGQHD